MLGTASTAAQPGAVSPIRGRPEAHPRPAPSTAQIRGATFFEDFESTPVGALPPGWTYYQEGGSLPEAHWFVLSDFGRRIAYSGAEPGDGTPDADWLLAPPVTPQPGDHLVFDSSQGFSEDRGDRFYVLASTTTGAPTAYVDTLAAFTETSLPNYYDPVVLDLAAYAGAPVRLAFVHVSTAADPDEWRIDNVTVRALQQAAVLDAGMVFEEAGLYGPPLPVDRADVNPVATANVRVVGDAGEVDVTGLTFTSEGTTDPEQVTSATLYYTGAVPFIAFPDEGNVVFDQIAGSGPTFAFEGALSLPPGDHYFWLVYTFAEGYRPVYPYPQADAAMVEIVAGGEAIPASVPTLDGSFDIVVAPAPNDSLAQAAEIGPAGGRYGSTTLFATDQLDLGEPSASCTDDGTLDGRNSVWWRFTAPAEGRLTVDLSPSDFNTVLTVLDARPAGASVQRRHRAVRGRAVARGRRARCGRRDRVRARDRLEPSDAG